ncbi:MAG: hypothetical protein KC731_17395, partial [Myxococcales bacterium]|nr:hypothetical protein [Myxococcales bacterium]
MTERCFQLIVSAIVVTSCSTPSSGSPPERPPRVAPAAPTTAAPTTLPPPAATPTAAPDAPAPAFDTTLSVRISPDLRCELAVRAFLDPAEPSTLSSIERLAVIPSDGCAAAVLFDIRDEPDSVPASGGRVTIGHVADPVHEVAGVQLADMSFDGLTDLCVLWFANGSGSVIEQWRKCWLFDPETHTFTANDALSKLVWPVFDPKTKTIEAGITLEGERSMRFGRSWTGPDAFTHGRYRWAGDTLETLEETAIYLHGKPGDPTPPNGETWMTRDQRRGNQLIRVYDGP